MINLPQGFKVGAAEAVDSRLVLSKAEMLTVKDSLMPEIYFTICKDDNSLYIYSKTNDINLETGKFRLYNSTESQTPSLDFEWGILGDNK